MKYSNTSVTRPSEILYNDHYVAFPYNCDDIAANSDGIIEAGTIIPANDSTAVGVLLSDVKKSENPNGTIVVHGFIKSAALGTAPSAAAISALAGNGVIFINNGLPLSAKYAVTYHANGGTGTVTDSSSPYTYNSTVTVKASSGLTAPEGKQFSGWALTSSATVKNDDYDPTDTFAITGNVNLYAVWVD